MVWKRKKDDGEKEKLSVDKQKEYDEKIAELEKRLQLAKQKVNEEQITPKVEIPTKEPSEPAEQKASVGNFNPFEAEILGRMDMIIKLLRE